MTECDHKRIEQLAQAAGRPVEEIIFFIERDGLEYTEKVVAVALEAKKSISWARHNQCIAFSMKWKSC